MSSHHFVRENQEPALFLLQMEQIPGELLGELLEWVPTVLTTEEILEKLHLRGVKIDAVVADLPPAPPVTEIIKAQHPLSLVDKKGKFYVEAGLEYLLAAGQKAVNILGMNYQETPLLDRFLDQMDLVVFDGPIRYFPVKTTPFKKWMTAGTLQLHGRENSFVEITTGGHTDLYQIKDATFLEIEEGSTTFSSKELFWVGEFVAASS